MVDQNTVEMLLLDETQYAFRLPDDLQARFGQQSPQLMPNGSLVKHVVLHQKQTQLGFRDDGLFAALTNFGHSGLSGRHGHVSSLYTRIMATPFTDAPRAAQLHAPAWVPIPAHSLLRFAPMPDATPQRILLIGPDDGLRACLHAAGFEVLVIEADADLYATVDSLQPDAVLLGADSPSRDTLEHLATLSRQVGAQLRFLRLNQKEKMVEAVGIEPTT